MKVKIIWLFLIVMASPIFAQGKLVDLILDFSPTTHIDFYDDRIEIKYYENNNTEPIDIKRLDSNLQIVNDLYFFDFYYPGNIFLEKGQMIEAFSPRKQKWLVLFCKDFNYVTIFNSEEKEPIYNFSYYYSGVYTDNLSYTASSYLSEDKKLYAPENLKNYITDNPWVDGVEGYGIGEKINISYHKYSYLTFSDLIISNGYVSYSKPELYHKNSRVKKIRVWYTDIDKETYHDYDINDSPNYQLIELDYSVKNITVEIIEVYKGDLWDDTCINLLIPVIPQL